MFGTIVQAQLPPWVDDAVRIVLHDAAAGLHHCAAVVLYDNLAAGVAVRRLAAVGAFPRGAVITNTEQMNKTEAMKFVQMVKVQKLVKKNVLFEF